MRKDKDQSEIKPQETTEEEVKEDLVSTKGILSSSEILILTSEIKNKDVLG